MDARSEVGTGACADETFSRRRFANARSRAEIVRSHGQEVLYGDMADDESPPNEDELKMFDMYRSLGGESNQEEYMVKMRTFIKYTLLSWVIGIGPPDDLTTEDKSGCKYFRSRDEAAHAYMEAVNIDMTELNRIFRSIDLVHAYT